ncbi:hypothetical protein J4734_04450 [Klebsiella pneumoniae]|uniref:Integral membrane protein TerC n=1 Tax=Klebsiella pneumoniae TaxID=573 RepID=A0A939SUE4_KLEPN|nr:hypothetical protein [Klebsiella pneumoniae]
MPNGALIRNFIFRPLPRDSAGLRQWSTRPGGVPCAAVFLLFFRWFPRYVCISSTMGHGSDYAADCRHRLTAGWRNGVAMACRKLPPQKRTKAIIGTVGAIPARVLLALYLLSLPWLKIVARCSCCGLASSWSGMRKKSEVSSSGSLWRTAITITVADVIMSLDNVLAVAAGKGHIALVALGVAISIPVCRRQQAGCSPAFPRWCCWAGCSSAGLPGQCWSATLPFASCFPAGEGTARWRRRRAAGAIHRMALPPTAAGED